MVVSHGITLQMIITAALEVPLSGLRSFRVAVGSVSILHVEDHWSSLVRMNDTSYFGVR